MVFSPRSWREIDEFPSVKKTVVADPDSSLPPCCVFGSVDGGLLCVWIYRDRIGFFFFFLVLLCWFLVVSACLLELGAEFVA
jgi:hypothetical protein